MRALVACWVTLLPLIACASNAPAPDGADAPRQDAQLGRHLEYVRLRSAALQGNLIGDPHEREYAVLLPPSYFKQPSRRFPVVYLLHGLGKRKDGHLDTVWVLRNLLEEMKKERVGEMILVAVDGTTAFGGSYYAASPTIGDFERYIVQEIVGDVDRRYRTVATRAGRGIAGFSMGGHGALKLGMKYSDAFSALGSLSGSPMSIRYRKIIYKSALDKHKRPTTLEQLLREFPFDQDWTTAAAYAKAAAFSPNPKRPPLYLDLPFETGGADIDDPVWQLWWDDDPLSLVAKHQRALRGMKLLYLDHGDNETALGTEDFVREVLRYGISHVYYVFRGDHSDRLTERHVRMLRHFAIAWEID